MTWTQTTRGRRLDLRNPQPGEEATAQWWGRLASLRAVRRAPGGA